MQKALMLTSLAIPVFLIGSSINAAALPAYTIEDIGNLGGTPSYAVGINSSGQVAGYSNTSAGFQHAMVWSNNGSPMGDLGTLGGLWSIAYGINDAGQVVGYTYLSNGTTKRATLWNKINDVWTPTDLGTYSGYNSSTAYGINNLGQVVGDSVINITNTGTFAMIWNPGSPIRNLGGLGGSYSVAYGINDSGQVVGYGYLSGDLYANAVLWSYNGTTWTKTDLGTLSGSYNTNSVAYGINASGQIVGISYLSSSKSAPYHATLWTNTTGNWILTDLGTLGDTNSWAHGINVHGQIVGYANTISGAQHATIWNIWNNGTIQDLNDLVDLHDTYLNVASGINDSGQIVANGANGHAYLLTPASPANTFTLSVNFTGTGCGTVTGTTTGTPGSLSFNTSGSVSITSAASVTLQATAAEYSLFTDWLGACSGTGNCVLTMDGEKSVTAEFTKDLAHMTWIDGTTNYFPTLQGAYNGASTGNTIKAWGAGFAEELICNATKALTLKGGYDMNYTINSSYTLLHGKLIIQSGSLTLENLVIL